MVCFRSRNGDRAGFGFAPAARLAAPATREAAERSIHLAADIVSEESVATRGFTFLGFCFCFVCSYSCTGVMGLGWVAAVLVFLGPNPSFSLFFFRTHTFYSYTQKLFKTPKLPLPYSSSSPTLLTSITHSFLLPFSRRCPFPFPVARPQFPFLVTRPCVPFPVLPPSGYSLSLLLPSSFVCP